jgi:hypothetical protein
VAGILIQDRYLPNLPPQSTSDPMREYLRSELDLLALGVNGANETVDALRAVPRMFLGGHADNVTMNVTPDQFKNYDLSAVLGIVPVDPDPVAGTITIPRSGAYRMSAYFYGLQQSVTQNESIRLRIGVDGVLSTISAIDVTSNQTSDRAISVTMTRVFQIGEVISMWIEATGDLGVLDVQQTTLELTFIQPTEPEAVMNLAWQVV